MALTGNHFGSRFSGLYIRLAVCMGACIRAAMHTTRAKLRGSVFSMLSDNFLKQKYFWFQKVIFANKNDYFKVLIIFKSFFV